MPRHIEFSKNHRFRVYLGKHELAFSRVSGLGGSIEKEVFVEGGGMTYPHVMQIPKSQLRSLSMERGIQADHKVIRNLRPGVFIPWIQIIVLGEDGKPYYEYYLEEAWVTKWDVLDLDAMGGKIMIDTFEIEYVRSKRSILQ